MQGRTTLTLLLSVLLCTIASAQAPVDGGEVETVTVSGAPPALVAVGVSGGFPSYQTVALSASLQSSFVGLQLKGSWTPAGPYLGVQLRGYPPIEVPVPLFVGIGAGIYGGNASYHAAVGAHVPLSLALRLDLEAGVASVPLLESRGWAPHVVVGVSYAFPIDLSAATSGPDGAARASRSGDAQSSGCALTGPPDEGALSAAFERTLAEWLAGARDLRQRLHRPELQLPRHVAVRVGRCRCRAHLVQRQRHRHRQRHGPRGGRIRVGQLPVDRLRLVEHGRLLLSRPRGMLFSSTNGT